MAVRVLLAMVEEEGGGPVLRQGSLVGGRDVWGRGVDGSDAGVVGGGGP